MIKIMRFHPLKFFFIVALLSVSYSLPVCAQDSAGDGREMLEMPAPVVPEALTEEELEKLPPAPVAPTSVGPVTVPDSAPNLHFEEEPPEVDFMEIFAGLPADVQEELMEEADRAFNYCSGNYMLSNFYDCSCYTMTFMEERYEKGPEVPFIQLLQGDAIAECVFEPSIAGYIYTRCTTGAVMDSLTDKQVENMCQCASRATAMEFKKKPWLSMGYVDRMYNEIYIECRRGVVNPF
jgi:hypothetical protein